MVDVLMKREDLSFFLIIEWIIITERYQDTEFLSMDSREYSYR